MRITGFGRGFGLLNPEYTGALFVMVKLSGEEYKGYIFNTDEDIQDFLDSFGLTPAETNRPIELNRVVYCIIEIPNVANQKRTMLHDRFGYNCKIAS